MSEIHVVPKDMKAAITVATEAESSVRKADSAGHLSKAQGAVPGAESVNYMSELGTSWTNETKAAADSSQKLATEMQNALNQYQTADAAAAAAGAAAGGALGGN
ncbi:hypothetical protein [Nocardioides albus]|uniref:Excreted virulence factor EspC, type VII ESX diderm n=1 Tax=Nocardioides albus TaxID=1841 RepID=A0A7W5A742_9ACTN|nr:hypothetical protein [Nocardioides albus]MBB3090943.1 hypothetical protein [Nocardioides albus]GGU38529.1 hypothetical protein GCM10007979_42160 [Nocardioides albus]